MIDQSSSLTSTPMTFRGIAKLETLKYNTVYRRSIPGFLVEFENLGNQTFSGSQIHKP